MATNARTQYNRNGVRRAYYVIGRDQCGHDHVHDTRTDTIHIIGDGGGRDRRVVPEDKTIDDYVDLVADRGAGWDQREYGVDLVAAIARGVDA